MSTIAELERVGREISAEAALDRVEYLRRWADTIAAYIARAREQGYADLEAELERYKALLNNADGPTQLPQLLTDAARPHYLTADQVKALHPLDTKAFAEHTAAMTMVSERHGKGDLVILVTALLTLLARARAGASTPVLLARQAGGLDFELRLVEEGPGRFRLVGGTSHKWEHERAALHDQVSKLEAACAAKDAAFTTAIGDCPPVPLWFNCTSTAWAGGWDAAMRRMLQAKDRTPATGEGWVDITAAPVGIWNSESQGAGWGYAAEQIPNGTRVALVVLPQ